MATTEPPAGDGIAALAGPERGAQAARVLRAALDTAGFGRLARLVTAEDSAGSGSGMVGMAAMRPHEARELAALVDRAQQAIGR
jgi:hypothetical protein